MGIYEKCSIPTLSAIINIHLVHLAPTTTNFPVLLDKIKHDDGNKCIPHTHIIKH